LDYNTAYNMVVDVFMRLEMSKDDENMFQILA